MEFFIAFFVSFLVLISVATALALGRKPTYRPSKQEVLVLLKSVLDNTERVERWELFLSLPIPHDEQLETIREKCLIIAFGEGDIPAAGEGLNGAVFDSEGMKRLSDVVVELEGIIRNEPQSKWF